MIGNDIIDLTLARSQNKAGNRRFLSKVFTAEESSIITKDKDPELILWILWAMKESAYKAHQRVLGLPRKLNPKDFECFVDKSQKHGHVNIDNCKYTVQIEETAGFIHCYTIGPEVFKKIYTNFSEPKTNFLKDFSSQFKLNGAEYKIEKDRFGIPSLKSSCKEKTLPVSISHHGNFAAFLIPLINS